MSSFALRPATASDAAAVAEVVIAYETSLYGQTTYSSSDLEAEWEDVDLERDARVLEDEGRVVGYGSVHERGDLWRMDGYVHPDAQGHGGGALLVAALERDVVERGARRLQNGVYDADAAGRRLLERLGYRAVRVFREMRIELDAPPAPAAWPEGLRAEPFDDERDARAFHAAHQEAFSDHWEYSPRAYEPWRKGHIESEKFDPSLWCVVRAGDEIAAGTICVAGLYGGGWVSSLFTRRSWRGRGVGSALLQDAFTRFWDRGERSVGLGVDAESDTGAFRLYERAGMRPVLGWLMYEKDVGGRLRELRADDAEAVVAVIKHATPHRRIDAEEVRTWLTLGLVDPNDMCVLEHDGNVVGYVDIFVREDLAYLDVNGVGHEAELLPWAEERARTRGVRKVRVPVWAGEDNLAAAVVRRRYARVRSNFEMVIEVDDDVPSPPVWPDGIEVRPYRPEVDEQATYEAHEEAFRDVWDWRPTPIAQWRKFELEARGFDPSLWFLAWDGNEVAAVCLAFPERAGDAELGWISVLGVRRAWRKRGLGEALLRHALRELHARGVRRVGLGADAESPTGATRLYERVGMHVEVRWDSWEKELG